MIVLGALDIVREASEDIQQKIFVRRNILSIVIRRNLAGFLRSCTLHVDNISSFFFQLMHTNCYKTMKLLKSFKIIIVAPACFGLHQPSSGSSQRVLR